MAHYEAPWACAPVWQTPDPCIVVTLPNGLELMAGGGSDAEFTLSSWDGWTNGPDVRGGATTRESADGGVRGDVYLSGRNLVFEGLIKGRSGNHLWELQEELGSVLTRERWGTLRVDEEHLGLSRQIEVARGARPTITPLTQQIARYQVQFQSHSPLRVGVDEQSATLTPGTGVQVQNIGTMPANLYATLHGPLTNPSVTAGSSTWAYQSTIPAGERRTVDFTRRRVVDPETGTPYRLLATHGWPSIPPGESLLSLGGTGTGRGEFSWRSTWA